MILTCSGCESPGIMLYMHPFNERRYIVTSSLIGWTNTQNDPWEPIPYDVLPV